MPSELITLDTFSHVEKVKPFDYSSKNPTDPLEIIAVPVETIGEIASIENPTEPLERKNPLNIIIHDPESNNSESDEDLFEPANPNLLIFRNRVNDLPPRTTIDDARN